MNSILMEISKYIIEDGIEAVKKDYSKDYQKLKREGSLKGFEDCKLLYETLTDNDSISIFIDKFQALLLEANNEAQKRFGDYKSDYWYWRCRASEIEWYCNVISSIFYNNNSPIIVQPTVRALNKADEILKRISNEKFK